MNIKFSEIKPVGNFDSILEKLDIKTKKIVEQCHKEKSYNKSVANCITLMAGDLGLIDVFEEGELLGDSWDMDESMQCLLFSHILIMRLNDVAQLYLNNIEMDPPFKQLDELMKSKPNIYGRVNLINE